MRMLHKILIANFFSNFLLIFFQILLTLLKLHELQLAPPK